MAIAEEVPLAFCTISFNIIWLVFPDIPDAITRIVPASGINSDVDDAHIDTNNVHGFGDRFFRRLNGNHEVEQFVFPDEITLAP